MLPFIGLIVFTGIFPKPMLSRIEPSVKALIAHVEAKGGYDEPDPKALVIVENESEAATSEEGEG